MTFSGSQSLGSVVEAVTLKAALAGVEQVLSGTVVVDRIHLVAQWHDGAFLRWEPIAEVPLG
ncbi:hypothetical protein ACIOEX_08465 [Streptomyces sp. NPDC087850]|uniref:hypothetical protein n=1 Tax=Streptomyces sp. NPDC087850 TaxID=3365809 RepID=UPI0038199090